MKITSTDIKNASIVIESLNNIDKANIENSNIAITHFDFILPKYKKAYESKDKLTLAEMKFITVKTKKNKKGKVTVFVDKYLLPQKRMSDLMTYASASASDRKKALSSKESLQVTANNIKKFEAERSKKSMERELKNNPIKKAEALQEAYVKQIEKINNAILGIEPILKNEELVLDLKDKIYTFEQLSLLVKNTLLITTKDLKAYKDEQERIKKEKLDKAKNNKNINHSLSKNGIYANSKNTQKIMKDKQDQIDLENYETRRKEIENLNRQASAS